MKKSVAILLMLVMVLSMASCSLFSDDSKLKLTDNFTHTDPKDLEYDTRLVLNGDGFDATLEAFVNMSAYPDIMVYDTVTDPEYGEMTMPIGQYDYDETTGMATAIIYFDSRYEVLETPIDLGKPDASKMIDIKGDVTMSFVVYGNQNKAVSAYYYFFLADKTDKDLVVTNAQTELYLTLTEATDGVLMLVKDASDIETDLSAMLMPEETLTDTSAEAYARFLKLNYGAKYDNASNPFKPFEGHIAPDGLDYDKVYVFTGSAAEFMPLPGYEGATTMTVYVYEKAGKPVAECAYMQFADKAAADAAASSTANGSWVKDNERVNDTTFYNATIGADLEAEIAALIDYNVLAGDTIEDYKTFVENFYYASLYSEN